ncbi:Na+/H+ antiporter [Cytobacillus sp. Hz8]|uniref:Na+/H+ antiporter n=1 Tax=Cytobacillus sp. Hz8 TaxID=3347168 RepID=UPI0035DD3024
MDILMTVILLLVCLLLSNIFSHYIPFIPTALIQIAFGMIIALLFKKISFEIEAEWFLLLFVAPLLYNDGRHFPREELWRLRSSIFGNAIILVLLTTIAGGYLIHWMLPMVPLAAAFALAAILSPTDPVAVNGIAKRIHIPEKVLHLVRGESLINDASGLVAFNYAVAAVVTGYFSLSEALLNFSFKFLAGAILGLLLGLIVTWIHFILRKQGINDVTFHSLLQILTPFVIFIISEELLHASGVIAVVVAGIIHSLISERTETMIAQEQILVENIWSILLFILNGIVFLLLGLNIPSSMIETVKNPYIGNLRAVSCVIAIGVAILAIRFIWTYAFSYYEYLFAKTKTVEKPDLKTALFISLTGVRGAVTMAGVLSIPYVIMSGQAFPERAFILFIAAGVILFTLVAATVFLPLLSKKESVDGEKQNLMDLKEARGRLLLAAIKKIRLEMNGENEAAAYELMDEYNFMFNQIHPEPNAKEKGSIGYQQKMRSIRLMALKAERKFLHNAVLKDGLDKEIYETFEKSLDHREEVLSNNVRTGMSFLLGRFLRLWFWHRGHSREDEAKRLETFRLGSVIQLQSFQAALEYLEEYARTGEQTEIVQAVIVDYKRLIDRLKRPRIRNNEKTEEQKEELRIKVMDIERSEIQRMFESGEITNDQARELRSFVNYIESITLYEYVE